MVKYYKIQNSLKSEVKEIDSFVKAHPNASYFQSSLFFSACKSSDGLTPYFYVTYQEDNSIAGVLLVFRQVQYRLFPFNFFTSRTIIWGGPLVTNNDLKVYNDLYKVFSKSKPYTIYTQVRNLSDQGIYQETMNALGFVYEAHLNIIIDLTKTEEQLWQEVHSKRRNEVRRALKEGTTVEMKTDRETLEKCYPILQEVYLRAKLPLPKISHFEALLLNRTGNEGLTIFVAQFEGKIIGCMLCLAYGTTLFDYYAGAYSEYYPQYPNDLLPWEVFKWAKKNGFTKFDFGGAGKPDVPYGVREYKKKFGGEMVNYGRFEKIHFPLLFKVAITALRVWKLFRK